MRQAIILVGGRGTRLGAATAATPKPLLPIDGERLFLDYVLAALARQGIEDFILLAGFCGDQVEARYHGARAGGAAVTVISEPAPAGTAGALHYAADLLEPEFLMLNGDCLFDFEVAPLVAARGAGDLGALALRRMEDGARYGNVELEGGRIRAFREKSGAAGPALISGGFYVLTPAVLGLIEAQPCSIETDVFPKLAARDQLAGAVFDGYFIDIGLPHTLEEARRDFPARFGHLFS